MCIREKKIIVTKPNLPDTSRPRRMRRSIAEREATNSRRSGVPHQHPARLAPASERDADWPKIEDVCPNAMRKVWVPDQKRLSPPTMEDVPDECTQPSAKTRVVW